MNLSKNNEQLDVIGKRHEIIESELTSIAQSVVILQGTQRDTNENVATLENTVKRNTLDLAEMQINIRDLTETKQLMEQDMNSVKENLAQLVNQKKNKKPSTSKADQRHPHHWQKGKLYQRKQNWIL